MYLVITEISSKYVIYAEFQLISLKEDRMHFAITLKGNIFA